jgi:hypothetical protein
LFSRAIHGVGFRAVRFCKKITLAREGKRKNFKATEGVNFTAREKPVNAFAR